MSEPRTPPALSEPERRRTEEVDRLAALGPAGVPALVALLDDPSWIVRRGVIASLAALGEPAVGPLCGVLRARRDNEARLAAAVDALVSSRAQADAAVLALSLDPNPAVVADAAQILGRRRSKSAVSRLAELASHRDENVAVAAIEALGRVGGRAAVDALVEAVESGKFFRTFPAIDVLGRSGDPRAVGPLAALLDDPRYLLEAARALGRTGSRHAVAPLARLLSRPGDAIVRVAALALAELRDRYGERYGGPEPIEETLRRAAPIAPSVRRLCRSLGGAGQPEQVALCAVLGAFGGDDAVAELTRLLDGPPPVASAAADALARLGHGEDARLLRALRDGDSARRLLLLPLVTSDVAEAEVVRCLEDPDPDVRAAACDALARTGDPRAVPALFTLLGDRSPRAVHAAVSAIQTIGSGETEPLAASAARDRAPAVRRAALGILAYFGYHGALPIFLERLLDPDRRVRERAVQGLAFVDDPRAVDALVTLASDPSARSRGAAMRALGRCEPEPRVLERLVAGLSDADAWVRYYACQSLGKLRHDDAAEAVAALLDDEAGQVRIAAIEALSAMRGEIPAAALQRAADARDADVQREALIGLGIARRPASLPALLRAVASSDAATRLVAVSAIAGFASPEVLPAIAGAARDPDESVSSAAVGILAALPGAEATALLVALLRDAPIRPRVLAALATPVASRIEGLLAALAVADDELAPHLTASLARMRRDDAGAALLAALSAPSVPARKAAVTTLAALGTRETFVALEHAAANDPDPEIRRICALVVTQWAA